MRVHWVAHQQTLFAQAQSQNTDDRNSNINWTDQSSVLAMRNCVLERNESETKDNGVDEDLLRRHSGMVSKGSDKRRELCSRSQRGSRFGTESLTIKGRVEFRRRGRAHGLKRITHLTGSLVL